MYERTGVVTWAAPGITKLLRISTDLVEDTASKSFSTSEFVKGFGNISFTPAASQAAGLSMLALMPTM